MSIKNITSDLLSFSEWKGICSVMSTCRLQMQVVRMKNGAFARCQFTAGSQPGIKFCGFHFNDNLYEHISSCRNISYLLPYVAAYRILSHSRFWREYISNHLLAWIWVSSLTMYWTLTTCHALCYVFTGRVDKESRYSLCLHENSSLGTREIWEKWAQMNM